MLQLFIPFQRLAPDNEFRTPEKSGGKGRGIWRKFLTDFELFSSLKFRLSPDFESLKLIRLQKFLSRLFNRLMKSWSWVLLIVATILIKWASLYPDWVEKNYTYGIFPVIAKVQRFLFGWLPVSI